MRFMLHLGPGQQRQVKKQWIGRDRCHKGTRNDPLFGQIAGAVQPLFHPHRFNAVVASLFNPVDPVAQRASTFVDFHHIACPQMVLRRRQIKLDHIASHPRLGQPAFGDATPLGRGQNQRYLGLIDRPRGIIGKDRFGTAHLIIAFGSDEIQPHPSGDFSGGQAAGFQPPVALTDLDQPRRVKCGVRVAIAHPKTDQPIALLAVKAIGQHKRLKRRSGGFTAGHRIAPHHAKQRGRVIIIQPAVFAQFSRNIGQRLGRGSANHPMALGVIRAIAP